MTREAVAQAKQRLREAMQARRRALSEQQRRAAGEAVAAQVLSAPEFRAALRVAAYVALPDEVPTEVLLRAVLDSGRALLLPRAAGGEGRALEFAVASDLATLRRGRFGALEPAAEAPAERLDARDLVLLPGLAFDRAGQRLGRGRGCYDRALAPGPDAPALFGLAFGFQLVQALPVEPHDRPVDAVATEAELHRVG